MKYLKRGEFRAASPRAYASAYDQGLLDQVCLHMPTPTNYKGVFKNQAIDGEKLCSKCNKLVATELFFKNASRHDGLDMWCKTCHKTSQMKSKYGLKSGEYDKMLLGQGGVCAICLCPEVAMSKWGTPRNLSLDHNHDTGKPRGLLCHCCNLVVGKFKDDPLRFKKAAEYLENHQ